jgi:plastocyanin
MNSRAKVSLTVIAVLLSLAIIVLPALTERLAADTHYLPLVISGVGSTATIVPTLPVDPTETTATPTVTAIPNPSTTVTVTLLADNTFSPAAVQINVGDTVVWVRTAGFHNVRADDDSFRLGEDAAGNVGGTWTSVSHTFTQAGTFGYYCEAHGGSGGLGMSGTVTVQGSD